MNSREEDKSALAATAANSASSNTSLSWFSRMERSTAPYEKAWDNTEGNLTKKALAVLNCYVGTGIRPRCKHKKDANNLKDSINQHGLTPMLNMIVDSYVQIKVDGEKGEYPAALKVILEKTDRLNSAKVRITCATSIVKQEMVELRK